MTSVILENSTYNGRRPDSVAQSLPSISTRYRGVPKRYEETRPVVIQGHAHTRILGIGQELHNRTLEVAEFERQKALKEAEQIVWSQADHLQAQAVQRAREEAALEQERILKKLTKNQEKALKEEALRVEMAMQKLAIEQVKQARAEGEAKLKEAVHVTEVRGREELRVAVEKAILETKTAAAKEAERIAKINKDKYDTEVKRAADDKTKCLAELETKKNTERLKAVREAEEREKKIGLETAQRLVLDYESRIKVLQEEIVSKDELVTEREKVIVAIESEKKKVEIAIEKIQVAFQDFIDRIRCFEQYKGQADYLLDSVYADQIASSVPYNLVKVKPSQTS